MLADIEGEKQRIDVPPFQLWEKKFDPSPLVVDRGQVRDGTPLPGTLGQCRVALKQYVVGHNRGGDILNSRRSYPALCALIGGQGRCRGPGPSNDDDQYSEAQPPQTVAHDL